MTDSWKKIGFCLFVGILTLLWGCGPSTDKYERHIALEGEMWEMHQMLPFEFNVSDTLAPYQLSLNFRYTEDYPYQDIFLFLQTTLPDGSCAKDTLHADLFTSEGKPLGKGHRVKELEIPYGLLQFPKQGKYVMHYLQAMREDSLQGITSFGIRL